MYWEQKSKESMERATVAENERNEAKRKLWLLGWWPSQREMQR